jgi:hypothetical protein
MLSSGYAIIFLPIPYFQLIISLPNLYLCLPTNDLLALYEKVGAPGVQSSETWINTGNSSLNASKIPLSSNLRLFVN